MHHTHRIFALIAGLVLASLSLHAQGAQLPISWQDNSTNEDGFIVERAPAPPSTAFGEVGRVAANVKTYIDSNLPYKTTFQYRIRAYNVDTTSAPSNIATGTTGAAPLNAPSGAIVGPPIATYYLAPGESNTVKNSPLATRAGSKTKNVPPGSWALFFATK